MYSKIYERRDNMSDSIYYSSTDAGVAAIILSFLAAYFVIILVIGIVC